MLLFIKVGLFSRAEVHYWVSVIGLWKNTAIIKWTAQDSPWVIRNSCTQWIPGSDVTNEVLSILKMWRVGISVSADIGISTDRCHIAKPIYRLWFSNIGNIGIGEIQPICQPWKCANLNQLINNCHSWVWSITSWDPSCTWISQHKGWIMGEQWQLEY